MVLHLKKIFLYSENREPALNVIHQSLSRKEINQKLRNSSFSCRTFLLCDGGGTILQLGAASNYHNWNWSVRTVDTRVYTCIHAYTRVYIRVLYVYSSCLRSPEQGESISLCNFCRGTASSFTHRDWTLHAFTHTHLHLHTHRLELYIARQEIYHGKIGLHMRYNTMRGQNILTAVLQSLGGHVSWRRKLHQMELILYIFKQMQRTHILSTASGALGPYMGGQ